MPWYLNLLSGFFESNTFKSCLLTCRLSPYFLFAFKCDFPNKLGLLGTIHCLLDLLNGENCRLVGIACMKMPVATEKS